MTKEVSKEGCRKCVRKSAGFVFVSSRSHFSLSLSPRLAPVAARAAVRLSVRQLRAAGAAARREHRRGEQRAAARADERARLVRAAEEAVLRGGGDGMRGELR